MTGLADVCAICNQEFPYSLHRCGFCKRVVCIDCGTRMAGAVFCSRACSHSFFYGGDEDVDERPGFDDEDE